MAFLDFIPCYARLQVRFLLICTILLLVSSVLSQHCGISAGDSRGGLWDRFDIGALLHCCLGEGKAGDARYHWQSLLLSVDPYLSSGPHDLIILALCKLTCRLV